MKNAFVVSAALLLVGVIGGGYTAFRVGTTHQETAAESPAEASSAAAPNNAEASTNNETTVASGADPASNSQANTVQGTEGSQQPGSGAAPADAAKSGQPANEATTTPDPQAAVGGQSTADTAPPVDGSRTQQASNNPDGMVGSPNTAPAAAASAAEGANVRARDRESGVSPATVPTKPTSAVNPSGEQRAPAGSAQVPPGEVSTPAGGNAATTSPSAPGAQTGDPAAGKALFAGITNIAVNCAVCHGAGGKGGVGANLTVADGPKFWTDAQFLLALRQGQAPNKVLNTTMPRFSPEQLTDQQVTDIHAYVKTFE
ncbi:c-type cytochrome [Deinococcus sp.]|uniref:c-type cytochrome n=1 Tax=Deinococcus sp. TaxID=47478 RepID=UPI003B5C56D4